ncbi:MAG: hypothetical protein IIC73_02140, partial [Armatimonadetes bacterium]|nr:hypothetical protein [Armatimonadota bacterium]
RPTLSARLTDPLPRPPFALKVGDEAVRVEASGGNVLFAAATGDEPLLELTPNVFLKLLMGQPESHMLLTATGGDSVAISALRLMFPQTGNLTWPADWF